MGSRRINKDFTLWFWTWQWFENIIFDCNAIKRSNHLETVDERPLSQNQFTNHIHADIAYQVWFDNLLIRKVKNYSILYLFAIVGFCEVQILIGWNSWNSSIHFTQGCISLSCSRSVYFSLSIKIIYSNKASIFHILTCDFSS